MVVRCMLPTLSPSPCRGYQSAVQYRTFRSSCCAQGFRGLWCPSDDVIYHSGAARQHLNGDGGSTLATTLEMRTHSSNVS